MPKFLIGLIGQKRYDAVMAYLSEQSDSPKQLLRQPVSDELKELLLGDLREKAKQPDATEEAK